MHIRSWLVVTALTLLITGFTLSRSGWLGQSGATARRSVSRVRATTQDLFASESGNRYRTGEARHWKYLVLNR